MQYSSLVRRIEAEEAILGGILLDADAIGRVVELLRPEAFFVSDHQEIYKATLALHSRGFPTDLMHVANWLHDHKLLEKVGGTSKLAHLVDQTVSAVNIDRYAQLVMDKFIRRQLIQAGNEIAQLAYEGFRELPTIFNHIEEKISSIDHPIAPNTDPDERIYKKLISDIQAIELTVTDPGFKAWKLQKLAKQYDRSPRQLEEIYFKSLIADENEPMMTWKELHDRYGEGERQWLLHGFLPKGVVVALHALGGTGKTRLAYDMIHPLLEGTPWNGFPVTGGQRRAILIQTDESANDMMATLERRGFSGQSNIRYKTRWTVDHSRQLRAEIEQFKPELVIIDSLTSVSKNSVFTENEVEYARPILLLKDIAQEFNCTFILVHHSNKVGGARGTSAIFNSVSEVWHLSKDDKSNNLDRLLTIEKSRSRRPTAYKLRFEPEDSSWIYIGEEGEDENSPSVGTKDRIIKFLSDHRGIRYEAIEIQAEIGDTLDHVRRCCHQLAQDGIISSRRLKRQGQPCVYFIAADQVSDHDNSPMPTNMISNLISNCKPTTPSDSGVTDHLITKNEIFLVDSEGEKKVKFDDQMISNSPTPCPTVNTVSDQVTDHVSDQVTQNPNDQKLMSGIQTVENPSTLYETGDTVIDQVTDHVSGHVSGHDQRLNDQRLETRSARTEFNLGDWVRYRKTAPEGAVKVSCSNHKLQVLAFRQKGEDMEALVKRDKWIDGIWVACKHLKFVERGELPQPVLENLAVAVAVENTSQLASAIDDEHYVICLIYPNKELQFWCGFKSKFNASLITSPTINRYKNEGTASRERDRILERASEIICPNWKQLGYQVRYNTVKFFKDKDTES